jgi:pyruvyl transferase EpsI
MKIFLDNKNLFLFTRDEPSYCQFKDQLYNRVFLVPDIVLSLDDITSNIIRSGAMLAMRSDVEGKHTNHQKKQLFDILEKYYKKVTISDTTTNYPISINERRAELLKNWNIFMSSELVITDRLHGMIFAAITKTPCIVLNTYNHKLIGQYKWLRHLDFIRFTEFNLNEIENLINDIKNNVVKINQRNRYTEQYKKIIDLI